MSKPFSENTLINNYFPNLKFSTIFLLVQMRYNLFFDNTTKMLYDIKENNLGSYSEITRLSDGITSRYMCSSSEIYTKIRRCKIPQNSILYTKIIGENEAG